MLKKIGLTLLCLVVITIMILSLASCEHPNANDSATGVCKAKGMDVMPTYSVFAQSFGYVCVEKNNDR